MFDQWGTEEQKQEFILGGFERTRRVAFGLTEPDHGSDATHMETHAVRETRDGVDGWLINGEKMWITGMHVATHCAMFARTAGKAGDASGITCFLVPNPTEGLKIEEWMWTFNMPTDHPRLSVTNVWVPDSAILGVEGRGLALAQSFVHQNRIRQAASSCGAALYCIDESVKYARERKPFGEELARNQGIQFPLVELLGEPPRLRGRRPRNAGPRRHRLFAAQAVRAHLPPPPPLPDHRRQRGNPDAQGRGVPVRLSRAEAGDVRLTPPPPPGQQAPDYHVPHRRNRCRDRGEGGLRRIGKLRGEGGGLGQP
jgi:alkylation response protein AidB-like acyl-CoA dehydrogenase